MSLLWHVIDSSALVVLTETDIFGGPLSNTPTEAEQRLAAGAAPRDLLGTTTNSARTRIARRSVRAIVWVEASGWLLVKQHWLWDPIRIQFHDQQLGRAAYEHLKQTLAPHAREETARLSMHDLPMDPRLGFGILMCIFGVGAIISGACGDVEQGGGGRFGALIRILGLLGQEIGIVPAIVLGTLVALAGIASLIWWYIRRPQKRFVLVSEFDCKT